MVGAAERSKELSVRPPISGGGDEGQAERPGDLLMRAIVARVRQKAKQLSGYCDPVLLAISVPHLDRNTLFRGRDPVRLDIKQLTGSLTLLLPRLRHLSGVLLSLWDIEPLPFKSGVRLQNVSVVERSRHQEAYPRVRVLVLNPAADSPLLERGTAAMRNLL